MLSPCSSGRAVSVAQPCRKSCPFSKHEEPVDLDNSVLALFIFLAETSLRVFPS